MTKEAFYTGPSGGFSVFASAGDFISGELEGFTLHARIEHDDCRDKPDERQDGFWPSLDPKDAGWIGEHADQQAAFQAQQKRAEDIMTGWREGEWFYCGIVIAVFKDDHLVTDHGASLWGIECNYPGSLNEYLLEVANELAPEAIAEAKSIIAKLVA